MSVALDHRWRWALAILVALVAASGGVATAATLVEGGDELDQLCAYGTPVAVDGVESSESQAYHEQRRSMVHAQYETPLTRVDSNALTYDRVSGLLSLSAFRNYQPSAEGPGLHFRNPSLVRFEIDDEEKAQDLRAQLDLGTIELRVGYQLAARYDYEKDYCQRDDEREVLSVDLLYVRLVETGAGTDEASLATYHSRLGYRQRLRHTMSMVDGARPTLPEVQISHIQWRRKGLGWADGPGEEVDEDVLDAVNDKLRPRVERALYPCYVQMLSANPSLQGALVVEVPTIGADPRPRVLMDTISHREVRDCLEDRVEAMDFPAYSEEWDAVIEGLEAMKWTILMRRR